MAAYEKPDRLYEFSDLLQGYERDDRMGFAKSWDFRTYCTYIADGAVTPRALDVRLAQAEHDARIAEALRAFLDQDPKPKLVGIMGGHGLSRKDIAYVAVARLGRHLTQNGYLVVTGGGPGAMEAAHVGATFSNASNGAFEQALALLADVPVLPNMEGIVGDNGEPTPGREYDFNNARLWLNKALDVLSTSPDQKGESLAIPTWFYGSEPSTPFASAYAKYFQNSIREEALITQSRAGIIYAQGGGGTLREIFEDTEQNYYAKTPDNFTPMIFFDPDGFWQRDAEFDKSGVTRAGINVSDLLKQAFRYGRKDTTATLKKVRFTTNFAEIDQVLGAHAPIAQQNLAFALATS